MPVRIAGPAGFTFGNFLDDTGSVVTSVDASLIESVGYSARDSRKFSRLFGTGDSPSLGYVLTVNALDALDARHAPFEVHVHDMPREDGIDGLLGMDWLLAHTLVVDGPAGMLELLR